MFPQQIAYLEQQLWMRRTSALQTYRHPAKLTEEATWRGREGGRGELQIPCATSASCATTRRHLRHKILHYLWMHLVSTTTERTERQGRKKCHESMKYARYWYENRREERQMNYKLSTRRERRKKWQCQRGEREKIDSERLFSCAVGNWEVYSKEIRWVIFSLFLGIKFDLPAMNSRYKFERDNAGRTIESMADI